MKTKCIAACLALSLGLCSTAMAKDIDAIDVFGANSLSGIASADISSLVKNKMISEAISASGADDEASVLDKELKKYGINYKKDIKNIVIAIDMDQNACAVVDASKSLKDLWNKTAAEAGAGLSTYKSYQVISEHDANTVLLSDTRILLCDEHFDYKVAVDNIAKPKKLKDSDKVLYTAYSLTDNKADIRVGAKMIDAYIQAAGKARLSDGKVSVSASDAEAASISINFKSGLAVDAQILGKSDKVAADAAAIFNKKAAPYLNDPSLAEMGIGFLSSAVSISSKKKYVIGTIRLNDDQCETLIALLTVLMGADAGNSAAAK